MQPLKKTQPRIGAVPYLNAKPLIFGLAGTLLAHPSKLALLLSRGRVDVAMVPSIELHFHPAYRFAGGMCISSRGPAESVKFFFMPPLKEIRRVFLDPRSLTSNCLVKIVLREKYGLKITDYALRETGTGGEVPPNSGFVIIGDRCLALNVRREKGLRSLDLGEEWFELTGLPFVFALWVSRTAIPTEVARLLMRALDRGLDSLDTIARIESANLKLPYRYCYAYLTENIHYVLGKDEKKGIEKFLQMARRFAARP